MKEKAFFHLPGLFEFYELYKIVLPLFREHREYFYDWCDIGSVYGAPMDCLWGGGRVESGQCEPENVLKLMADYGISARLTFSNSLLAKEHLLDKKCNSLCAWFEKYSKIQNGVIVHSDLLKDYLLARYPNLYLVSSTTKVITEASELLKEINKEEFAYVVPDFRFNRSFDLLSGLTPQEKDKVELLCNECCSVNCGDRKRCYEDVSRKNLGEEYPEHHCTQKEGAEGYRFYKAMENPSFIGTEDIVNTYLPMGFSNYKIEGRGLGSALVFEMLLYYMVKPEYQIVMREKVYLDNMLDLF